METIFSLWRIKCVFFFDLVCFIIYIINLSRSLVVFHFFVGKFIFCLQQVIMELRRSSDSLRPLILRCWWFW